MLAREEEMRREERLIYIETTADLLKSDGEMTETERIHLLRWKPTIHR